MSLSKCYQDVLTYESVRLIKRPVSMNTLMKVLKLKKIVNTNDEMRNHLMSYDSLMVEANFYDVWDKWNGTLYWALIG